MRKVLLLVALTWAWTVSADESARPALEDPAQELVSAVGGSAQEKSVEVRFETPASLSLSADARWVFGEPLALSGTLTLPAGPGPFALVVLVSGCQGITPVETGWATVLGGWGYATFLLDSFSGRDLEEVCTQAPVLRPIQRVPDAYGALSALSRHPKVDAGRAALMGFSHGGAVAITASTAWARRQFASAARPAFRAFVSFYPANCNVEYPELGSIAGPLRIHVGALDDWTPAAPCVARVRQWKASRQDADITVYADARHAFDYPDLAKTHLPDVDNGAGCTIRMASVLGPVVPPVEGPACVRKGATVEGHQAATALAEQQVRSQLAAFLK